MRATSISYRSYALAGTYSGAYFFNPSSSSMQCKQFRGKGNALGSPYAQGLNQPGFSRQAMPCCVKGKKQASGDKQYLVVYKKNARLQETSHALLYTKRDALPRERPAVNKNGPAG
eukprot:533208-Pelagomonas_calceolata.AAC.3